MAEAKLTPRHNGFRYYVSDACRAKRWWLRDPVIARGSRPVSSRQKIMQAAQDQRYHPAYGQQAAQI